MKTIGLLSKGVLIFCLGSALPMFAQQEKKEAEKRPNQRREDPGKPQDRGQPSRERQQPPERPTLDRRPEARPQRRPEPPKLQPPPKPQPLPRPQPPPSAQQRRPVPPPISHPPQQIQRGRAQDHHTLWQGRRATNWQMEHRSWQDRGGYNGYRIPDRTFHGSFGPNHRFRLHSYPVRFVGGFLRFQFGGFGFNVIDPWPEYWSDDWYENDEVYVDYTEDGYYLYNRRYPQDRIAISIGIR
ncbi:MAG: hypothetical protein IPN59_06000 [Holophaga sp.]|nr:hypothetical protein [Holophaga sp.]